VGFSLIQSMIAFVSYKLAKLWQNKNKITDKKNYSAPLITRFLGCFICGIGITFISQSLGG